MKKIIFIFTVIICAMFFDEFIVNASEIETTQVNTEEAVEDFPTILIDIYNTEAYKMSDDTIFYLPSIVEEEGVVWAIYKKDNSNYCLTLAEEITYKTDGIIISNGYNYKFSSNGTFDSFYNPGNLMYISGSHANGASYGSSSYYCTGSFYSSIDLFDVDGNIARSANLVKVTEEDPDVPVDPEDPVDPDEPVVDNTELTEAIKENTSILNRIYKVLNNLFIMYLFFSLTPYITVLSKRFSGKEFK